MERQLLIISISLILIVGCQQMGVVENYNKEKIVESIPINNTLQHENKIITYEDIWEYILNNNRENKEAYINEQILFYMNQTMIF